MKRSATGILSFLAVSAASFSQSYNFKIYSIDEGIPQSQVHSIVQDHDGFMWFGTDGGGLTSYDGKNFITYSSAEGLSNDLVTFITEMDRQLWIGTSKGLSIFKNKRFLDIPEPLKGLPQVPIYSITRDSKGNLRFCTQKGAFIYNGKTLEEVPALKDKSVLCIYEDPKGNFFYGTNANGVMYEAEGKGSYWYTTDEGLGSNTVSTLAAKMAGKTPEGKATLGGVYFGTEGALNYVQVIYTEEGPKYDTKAQTFVLPTTSLKHFVRHLNYDRHGNLWAVSWTTGLFRIGKDGQVAHFGKNEGLGADGGYYSMEDREGNIWTGTDGSGAVKLGLPVFSSISKRNGLPLDMVLALCKTRNGEWWFGHDAGASHFNGKTWETFNASNGLSNEKVWDIMEDTGGNIWITTYGSGVYRYDGKHFINYNDKNGLSGNNIRSVFQDSKERIWVGSANGLNLFDGKSFRIFRHTDSTASPLKSSRILGAMEDSKHRVWFSTSGGGLAMLKESDNSYSFDNYTEAEGLAGNIVLSAVEDPEGNIWAGSFGGISRINPSTKRVQKITRSEGLPTATIYGLGCTGGNYLFIGSNSGVDKFDITEFSKNGKLVIRHFGKEEGFFGVECNTNSILKDTDGKLWIGTINGVFIYDPAEDKINETEPLTHITGIRLFFENFDMKKYTDSADTENYLPRHMTFPYQQNHLSFDFAGISLSIPKNVRYRYMLQGFDKEWTDPIRESFATYSNLPEGNYTFKVIACNNDGKWNVVPATFSFTITPPFWKTWWFRVGSAAFAIFIVFGFFKYRIRRLKKTQEMLQEQVNHKTKELREEKELVVEQSKLIEKKNHSITSSIRYAKRIQDSILPLKEKLNDLVPGSFILFKPKDIVSGDFYWFTKQNGSTLVAAVDCTGHGVPGAFMSLIGNNLLNDIVNNQEICDPKVILEKLHVGVVQALKKDEKESGTVDGMDITLCSITLPNGKGDGRVEFASTGRPLVMIKENQLTKYKVGLHPVGFVTKKETVFEKHVLPLQHGDTFYIYTDGYADQFGGPEDEKFLDSNFEKLLLNIHTKDISEQPELLETEIEKWKNGRNQIDDILVIGIKA